MKKAIAYVSDIKLGYSNATIGCEEQIQRIKSYCHKENIQISEVVKEISPNEEIFERLGIQYLLKNCDKVDYIVVERPWCIGRKREVLNAFLKKLEEKQVKLICATYLWDCASQYVRRFYSKNQIEGQASDSLCESTNVKVI